jgi:hypothetical protein
LRGCIGDEIGAGNIRKLPLGLSRDLISFGHDLRHFSWVGLAKILTFENSFPGRYEAA